MTYGKTDVKLMRHKHREIKERSDRVFFRAKEGENIVRILPPWNENEKSPFLELEQHFADVKRRETESWTCPASIGAKYCYTCDSAIPDLEREIDEADSEKQRVDAQEIINRISSNRKVFCNVLDRTTADSEKRGPQIWGFSYRMFDEITGYFNDPDYGDITHPKSGTDLVLTRTGKGQFDTRYALYAKRKPTAVPSSVLDNLHDLRKELKPITGLEQKRILEKAYGIVADIEEEAESERSAARDRGRRTDDRDVERRLKTEDEEEEAAVPEKKPKRRVVEEPEDEELETPDETDDEEEIDDDEGDIDLEEDDEDEAPEDDEDTEDTEDEDEDEAPEDEDEEPEDDEDHIVGEENDDKRVPVVVDRKLPPNKRDVSIAKQVAKSPCYGKYFSDTSTICSSCAAVVECAVETERNTKPAPKRSAKPKGTYISRTPPESKRLARRSEAAPSRSAPPAVRSKKPAPPSRSAPTRRRR